MCGEYWNHRRVGVTLCNLIVDEIWTDSGIKELKGHIKVELFSLFRYLLAEGLFLFIGRRLSSVLCTHDWTDIKACETAVCWNTEWMSEAAISWVMAPKCALLHTPCFNNHQLEHPCYMTNIEPPHFLWAICMLTVAAFGPHLKETSILLKWHHSWD